MPTNYTLKPGHTLTVTAGAVKGSVHQVEDNTLGAVLQPGFSGVFGPYMVERNFTVSDGATVTTAESVIAKSFGGLLLTNAGAPVDAVRASANVNPAGDDNGLTFTARTYGTDGNSIRVTYVDPGANDAALGVAVSGPSIAVSLATDGDGLITSTADDIKTAIEADPAANALVSVAIMTSDSGGADDGSGTVTAMTSTSLASGAGTGVNLSAKGGLCFDTTNGAVYINNGTSAAPDWDGLTEATIAAAAFATTAQGALADTALQPADVGTAAAQNVGAFVSSTLHIANAGAPDDAAQATLSRNPAGDDNALTFTSVAYGTGANSITITYVDPAANDAALSVGVAGSAITVNLATDGGGAITSTAAQVKTAVEGSGAAAALVTVAIDATDTGVADDGSGVVTALASAPMTGGAGTAIGLVVPGGLLSDTTNANIYRNDGTQAVPVWKMLDDAP